MRTRTPLWIAPALAIVLAAMSRHAVAADGPVFHDDFSAPTLDTTKWQITRQNDFQESTIDIAGTKPENRRLRLRAATIGTDDRTVKFHGVRTREPVADLTQPTVIRFQLDWNNQANGCYLTAGIYLCPFAADTNPRDADDWLRVQYIGVPPGKNARCEIARRTRGRLRFIHTEGWPRQQRTGRRVGVVNVELRFGSGRKLAVVENGKTIFETSAHQLTREAAYLYLQMSSHSNYPPREIFFDSVRVSQEGSGQAE